MQDFACLLRKEIVSIEHFDARTAIRRGCQLPAYPETEEHQVGRGVDGVLPGSHREGGVN